MSQSDEPSGTTPAFADLYPEEYAAAFATLVIVASVTWGVLTRYVTATPAAWTTELAAIAFSWAVFLGSAAAFGRCEHITFDMHLDAWPAPVRRLVQGLGDLVVAATLLSIAVLSFQFTLSTWDVPTTVLRIPQGVMYAGAAVGFALMVLRHLSATLRRLRREGRPS